MKKVENSYLLINRLGKYFNEGANIVKTKYSQLKDIKWGQEVNTKNRNRQASVSLDRASQSPHW